MATKTNTYKPLLLCAYISLGIGVLLLIYFCILCILQILGISLCRVNDLLFRCLKDNPGEFLGGTVGTLFTLTATIFLFITFLEQRKQFESTQKSEFYTRFETTYFNMLSMLSKVQASINKSISESESNPDLHNVVDYYTNLQNKHKQEVERADIKDIHEALLQEELQIAEVLKAKQFYGHYFERYVVTADCNLGFFYRYIYNIVSFVYSQAELKEAKDKEKYLNLLQAQLSDEELALIFYDAISKSGENKDGRQLFHDMLDETHFLENIKPQVLLDVKHCYFYPRTTFKFMSRDDIRKAKALILDK